MKIYLLVFNALQLDPEIMRRKFSMMPELMDWLWFFGNSAVVKTYGDAATVGRAFHGQFPGLQFIVTEVSPSRSEGWLPQIVWDFINQSVEQKIAS